MQLPNTGVGHLETPVVTHAMISPRLASLAYWFISTDQRLLLSKLAISECSLLIESLFLERQCTFAVETVILRSKRIALHSQYNRHVPNIIMLKKPGQEFLYALSPTRRQNRLVLSHFDIPCVTFGWDAVHVKSRQDILGLNMTLAKTHSLTITNQ